MDLDLYFITKCGYGGNKNPGNFAGGRPLCVWPLMAKVVVAQVKTDLVPIAQLGRAFLLPMKFHSWLDKRIF